MKAWRDYDRDGSPRLVDPSVLSPATDEARLARQYDVVRERTLGRRRPARSWTRWPVVAVAVVTAAALAAFLVSGRINWRTPKVADSNIVVAGASEQPVRVALPEGSSVELAPNTRAKMTSLQPKAVRIDVETGSVEVEATHVAGRSFVVGAGPYEVRVTGTRFRVERIPGTRVSVHVDEGVVEVASAQDEIRRLGAGEEWSAPDTVTAPAGSSSPPTASAGSPGAPVATAVSAPLAPTASLVPSDSGAPVAVPVPARPVASAGGVPDPAKHGDADKANDLFEEAQRARGEGRAVDAARAFDRIRRTYRGDPHAPLAAFELGRLRLDVLQDPMGAEEALHDAMVLGPDSALREDAEARRVEALSRTGDRNGCVAARGAYLARWPNGTYRRTVELYCSK